MTPNKHLNYFESANVELSEAKLHFNVIPELGIHRCPSRKYQKFGTSFFNQKNIGRFS